MRDLEKMRQWLLSYPAWDDTLQVDFLGAAPGNAGLFPVGVEETGRREDLLGNLEVDCRCRFLLYRKSFGQEDGMENAQWLLDFQHWVRQQSICGAAPVFGDVPCRERLEAQKGALKTADQLGVRTYAVTLVVDFVKKYEAGVEAFLNRQGR